MYTSQFKVVLNLFWTTCVLCLSQFSVNSTGNLTPPTKQSDTSGPTCDNVA